MRIVALGIGVLLGAAFVGCKSNPSSVSDAAADVRAAPDHAATPDIAAELRPADLAAEAAVAGAETATPPEVGPGDADRDGQADRPGGSDTGAADSSDAPADTRSSDRPADTRADSSAVDTVPDRYPGDALGGDRQPTDGSANDGGCSGWTTLVRLSPADAKALIATGDPIVINVHVPYEGDIPGTDIDIAYTDVDAIEAYLKHDHCADVLLICKSGGMSQSAGNELIKRGYLRIRDLDGGMNAWEKAGYPLVKDGGV